MDTRTPPIDEVRQAVDSLVASQRTMCLWYTRRGYVPATDAERLAALRGIEQHGDREAYIRARELREWLLRASSET